MVHQLHKKPPGNHVQPPAVFGVSLNTCIKYASTQALLLSQGREISVCIPIIVDKCVSHLKETGIHSAGIFRSSGLATRISKLQEIFDSADQHYGQDLDWAPYTVHDTADVLRRYLIRLPETVIPLEFYEQFRAPFLRDRQQGVYDKTTLHSQETLTMVYNELINQLPILNQHLLLYILDFLALFSSHADETRMTSASLAVIFHPAILSRPEESLDIQEHQLSQDVLQYLIEHINKFTLSSEMSPE